MSERIDHEAEAKTILIIPSGDYGQIITDAGERSLALMIESQTQAIVAQVHATLALVEQQRIANLIALHRHEVKYDIGSWSRLYDDAEELLPEIAEALNLGNP